MIASKILLSAGGALVAFLGTIIAYWIAKRQERAGKTIFLSYSSQDNQIAETIAGDLRRDRFQVVDVHSRIRVGESISKAVENAVSGADYFVLIVSDAAKRSEWVDKELEYALRNRLRVLPVLTSETAEIPSQIADIKYVSLKDNYKDAYNELKRSISYDPTSS